MFDEDVTPRSRIWSVGGLCRAVADALDARFNPVAVRGEISGFTRAASGHCYFTLKDADGQMRCAMFKRAASLAGFLPRDGDLVEVQARLGVYEPRGDLQLIVESVRRAGQGTLFEQFLRLKARLEAEGLFDGGRKRALSPLPRGVGVVTSPGAAALRDVVTCLRRRAPHVPVVIAPASVQGADAPAELVAALQALYRLAEEGRVDVILLVRGGGSLEDLWAFNDEQLARTIVRSPVPLVSGVGHETDFTIADFCADLRAPTPTAAAELAAEPRALWLQALAQQGERLHEAALRRVDRAGLRLDQAAAQLGRPSSRIASQQMLLQRRAQALRGAVARRLAADAEALRGAVRALPLAVAGRTRETRHRLAQAGLRLELLDPRLVLRRGYAMLLEPASGRALTSVAALHPGEAVRAVLADGEVDLRVAAARPGDPP
ncbi:exodeoxyribonuclease VII large subunit [Ramlibacter sp.]|uniref:exodeoxyribonuclease VII large subunit n=1 Tax=Ramlibacter sp. TaxID=1917967 RepID=UPI0035B1A8B4